MRKEYKSEGIQYNFSEDISKDLITVNLFNPKVFDYNRDIAIGKDGHLTELDLINQVYDAEYYLEGVDINQLIEDMSNDFREHMALNKFQESIKFEVRDFKYNVSNNKTTPHTNFNLDIDGNTYNLDIPIYKKDDGKYSINDDNYGIGKIRDISYEHSGLNDIARSMSKKYSEEITRDTLQKVILEANKHIENDSNLISAEKKQKKNKGFSMSM